VDTSWDPSTKYTLWSGLIGGFFLQLSYFGTDQSQVQRYLGGQNVVQARQGLWMNAVLKIPMQFFILLTGVLVFVFYLFHAPPVHWNAANVVAMEESPVGPEMADLEEMHAANSRHMAERTIAWVNARRNGDAMAEQAAKHALEEALASDRLLREESTALLRNEFPDREPNDKDYIFISYVMDHLPIGIVGLLLAMIFSAGMSSTSAELSALATTSTVDVVRMPRSDAAQVKAARLATVVFGLLALAFAALFSLFENLIQAVNILGSLFYGTILGIFLVAFFVRWVNGSAVFIAALVSQAVILVIHFSHIEIAFLWYNLIAPAIVVVLAMVLQAVIPPKDVAS
jgi:Na+/proline symporter